MVIRRQLRSLWTNSNRIIAVVAKVEVEAEAKAEVRPEEEAKARAKAKAEAEARAKAKAEVEAEVEPKADFRLILNHLAEKIVRKKVSASLRSGSASMNARRQWWVFNAEDANVHEVILADLNRVLAWTGMLASRVDSQDVEEEAHRTFDFDTVMLLAINK